jgi:hypothetical protein
MTADFPCSSEITGNFLFFWPDLRAFIPFSALYIRALPANSLLSKNRENCRREQGNMLAGTGKCGSGNRELLVRESVIALPELSPAPCSGAAPTRACGPHRISSSRIAVAANIAMMQ